MYENYSHKVLQRMPYTSTLKYCQLTHPVRSTAVWKITDWRRCYICRFRLQIRSSNIYFEFEYGCVHNTAEVIIPQCILRRFCERLQWAVTVYKILRNKLTIFENIGENWIEISDFLLKCWECTNKMSRTQICWQHVRT